MFLIYLVISFINLFIGRMNGNVDMYLAQIWILVTLSVSAIVYGLETRGK